MASRASISSRKPYGSRTHRQKHGGVPALAKWLRDYGAGSQGASARIAFAHRCATSVAYLQHVAGGFRRVSMEMALKIEKETHGEVNVEQLLPEADWSYVTHRSLKRLAAQMMVEPSTSPPAPPSRASPARASRGHARARAQA